jgi:hypothetical protein
MSAAANALFHFLSSLLFRPFGAGAAPWGGLALFSLATAVLGLLAFKHASRQRVLKRVKSRLMAHILEIRLYQDNLGSVFHAFGALVVGTGRYLLEALLPVAVLAIPLGVWLGHMGHWLEWRPLQPGEATVLTVAVADGVDLSSVQAELALPDGLEGDAQPFISPNSRELAWRLRAVRPVSGVLTVSLNGGEPVGKRVSVSADGSAGPVFPERPARGSLGALVAGPEGCMPAGGDAASVRLEYPKRVWLVGDRPINWILACMMLAIGMGMLLKRPMNVVF